MADIKEVDALVVGGGFGGVRLAQLLKSKLNLTNIVAIEKGKDVGGTWNWNTYPGAQSDTESWVYRFSDDRDPPKWNTRYLKQADIQAQIKETAQKAGVYDSFIFENEVVSAQYDEARNRWQIDTDKGLRFSATYFVTALGILSRPNIPKHPGIDTFKGAAFHSARWPEGLDVSGKRVAVVGTGPSGSQITATIHPIVKHLTVFQQRAQYITPVNNRAISEEEKTEIHQNHKDIWDLAFNSLFAMGFSESKKSALEATEEERREVYERVWNKGGGFRFFFETFGDLGTSLEANETAAAFVRGKIAEIVKDPETAKLLQPKGAYGGRPLCAERYYEAFNSPNVSLVDIATNPIAKVTPNGLQLQDGQELEFDVIVLATGFDAVDGAYYNIDITGRNGAKLTEAWKDGPNALYGLSVANFPNFFTVSGPGGPFANIPTSIEVQGNFVVELIEEVIKRGTKSIEAEPKAQSQWDETVQNISKVTVFDQVKSWIQSNNIEGKKKYSAFYLAGLQSYRSKLEEESGAKYSSFVFA
jgi:cation diffusion facilitator CzcD-associated flavoprotein CzcO